MRHTDPSSSISFRRNYNFDHCVRRDEFKLQCRSDRYPRSTSFLSYLRLLRRCNVWYSSSKLMNPILTVVDAFYVATRDSSLNRNENFAIESRDTRKGGTNGTLFEYRSKKVVSSRKNSRTPSVDSAMEQRWRQANPIQLNPSKLGGGATMLEQR